MRFFPPSSLTRSTNRPRSRSPSSSSSSSIDEEVRSPEYSPTMYPATQPPPPTRASTGLQHSRPTLDLSPSTSTTKQSPSSRIDSSAADSHSMQVKDSEERSAYLPYSSFPPELFRELEEYDRRASQAEPLHYFSDNQHAQYVCKECMIPLALQDEVVSKAFSGSLGRAYLMHSTVNTYLGKKEEKRLLTGIHTVADLHCMGCQQLGRKTTLGWMYLKAKERDQEYKEGKYILEAGRVIKENNWTLDD